MAKILLLCLILTNSLMGLALATKNVQITAKPDSPSLAPPPTLALSHDSQKQDKVQVLSKNQPHADSYSMPLTLSPFKSQQQSVGQVPSIPNFSKNQPKAQSSGGKVTLGPSPKTVEGPEAEEHTKHNADKHQTSSNASEEENRGMALAEAPTSRRLGKHHSSDKSVTGGGVILGGLATTFFVSVFCYIRVTRRRNGETTA